MYNVMKGAISAGGYKLADIMHKIKKMYILGDLTEAQMDELLTLVSGGISPDAERPETIAMIQNLAAEIEALKDRVKALEGGNIETEPGDGEQVEQPEQPEQPVYPEWKPWDGISKDYQQGAIVSHNGELWESVFSSQNVWEPGAPGTESLWVKYTGESI